MPLVIDHHINNDCFLRKKGEAMQCRNVKLNIYVPVSLSTVHDAPAAEFHCLLLYSDQGKDVWNRCLR
jgi:hypothetical protein